jgi:hypothetical protein
LGHQAHAAKLAGEFRRNIEKRGAMSDVASACCLEAEFAVEANDLSSAVDCLVQAIHLFEQSGRGRRALWLELELADLEEKVGEGQAAEERRARAVRRAVDQGDDHVVGAYHLGRAVTSLKAREWFEAGAQAENAAESFRAGGEIVTRIDALLVLAVALMGQGATMSAREAASEAAGLIGGTDQLRRARLELVFEHLRAGPFSLPPEHLLGIADRVSGQSIR